MPQQKHLPCKWHPFHPGSMFPGLSRHVRYECCAVDLQEVSTQQGRKCRDAEMRCWGSSELNISADISARWCWPMRTSGLCLLCLCCRRFVDSFFFTCRQDLCVWIKTLKNRANKTKKSLKIWHVALCCFEEALFCCCLGGLPLCGQWRVGKHGKKSTERWRITGIT